MAIDPKQTDGGIVQQIMTPTFAGVTPDYSEDLPEMGRFSLVDDKPQEGRFALYDSGAPNTSIVDEKELDRKVDKFQFALGKDFSRDDIRNTLANGQETALRHTVARGQDIKDEQLASQVVKDKLAGGLPEDPEQQSIMYSDLKALHGFKPFNDANTIVEKLYAQNYVKRMADVGPEDNLIQQTYKKVGQKVENDHTAFIAESPEAKLTRLSDISEQAVMRQEVLKEYSHKMEEMVHQQSWGGFLLDFAKNTSAFYTTYKTYDKLAPIKGLPVQGENIQAQAEALAHLPPAELDRVLDKEVINGLAKDNPQLASYLMSAMISYSGTEKFFDNLGTVLAAGSVATGVGKMGLNATRNLITKGKIRSIVEKGLTQGDEVEGAFRDIALANADPKASVADKLASAGDLKTSAQAKILSMAGQIVNAVPGLNLNQQQVAGVLAGIVNPQATATTLTGGSSLSATQTANLAAHLVINHARLTSALNNQIKVARLPEEALQKAFEITINEFHDGVKQHVNNAVQNVFSPTKGHTEQEIKDLLFGKDARIDEFRKLAKSVASKEKVSDPATWTKEERQAYDSGNWEEFSRLRGYTKDEIEEYGRYQDLAHELIGHYGEDQVHSWDHEATWDPLKSVIKTKLVRPEDTRANIGAVKFVLAKPDGTAFSSITEATNWGTNQFGLKLGDFGAERVGNSWYITAERAIDETRDDVRKLLVPTNNVTPVHKWLPKAISTRLGAQERVSEFNMGNRLAATHGQHQLNNIVYELTKDIKLRGDSRQAVINVMEEDRARLPPPPSNPNAKPLPPGYYCQNIGEFESEFMRVNGRMPKYNETKAYFSAITANKIDWILNNDGLRKNLTRMGAKRTLLKMTEVDPKTGQKTFSDSSEFYTRKVDNLDMDADPMGTVAIYDEGQPVKFSSVGEWKNKAQEIEDLKNQGYTILHTFNPSRKPGKEVFGEDKSVNYIITKNHEMREVEATPIPFREGWHSIYDYGFYVKQPMIKKIVNGIETQHHFEGDRVWIGVHTQAEAQKRADAMNKAVQMAYHGAPGNLQQHLAENLPYTEKEFRDLFSGKDPWFSPDHEFKVVADGQTTTDRFGLEYKDRYSNFADQIRSPLNLMNQVDKRFVGSRDEVLHSIKEGKGGQGNPVFSLDKAEQLNPYSSVSKALAGLMRDTYMTDYRISAVESWLREFGDLMKVESKSELFSDANRHVYNSSIWKESAHPDDVVRINAGEGARKAIVEFMGHKSPLGIDLDRYKHTLLDKVYDSFGQDAALFVDKKLLANTPDPIKAARALAFHNAVGFMNPFHWFQNLMTMTYSVAASPEHGSKGAMAGILWHMSKYTNAAGTQRLADIAHKFGYDRKTFLEGLREFKKSGRGIIEGEHAFLDDFNDPSVFKSATGEFLDKTLYLFKGSEKTVRHAAYATAFSEWRAANPSKVLTQEIRNQILARSDMLTLNMTRASAASWQRGVFSPATQFLSFPARLMEMMLSSRKASNALTAGEKFRILGANSVLYGIPAGAVGTTFGAVYGNAYDDVRQHLLENKDKYGIDPDGPWVQGLHNGVLGTIEALATGHSSNIGARLGPGGGSTVVDKIRESLWNKATGGPQSDSQVDLFDIAFGASSGSLSKVWKNSYPLLSDFVDIMGGKSDVPGELVMRHGVQALQSVRTIDMAVKLYLGLANHAAYNTAGDKIGDLKDSSDAFIYALFNALPQDVTDAQLEQAITINRQKTFEEQLLPQYLKASKEWARVAWERGSQDPEAKALEAQVTYISNGMTMEEKSLAAKRMLNDRSVQEKMQQRWPKYMNQMNQVNEENK